MKIGFLTPEYITKKRIDGGLARYIQKTASELAKRGHQVTIFLQSDCDNKMIDCNVRIIEVKRYSLLHRVIYKLLNISKIFRFMIPVAAQVFAARQIANAVLKEHKETPFDIIQASSYMTPGLFLVGNSSIPVICRISSYAPLLRSAFGKKRIFKDVLTDWLEVYQTTKAEANFAPSNFIAKYLLKLEAITVDVIRTAIEDDIENFDYSFYENNLFNLKYLLFFGTLSKIKGVDLLAPVIPRIVKKYPKIIFVFIGRDNGMADGRKIFDFIRNKQNMPTSSIRYFSAIQKSQLYPVIENAEGVILPSRVDNYPNACLEAQSLGIPVVATNESSLDEIVTDNETGFIAKNNDWESLYGAIEKLLVMSEREKKIMIQKIHNKIEAIRKEDRIGELIKYYESVIKEFSHKNTK